MRDAKVRFGVSDNFAGRDQSLIKQKLVGEPGFDHEILLLTDCLSHANIDNNSEKYKYLTKPKNSVKSSNCLSRINDLQCLSLVTSAVTVRKSSGGGVIQPRI